MVLSFRLVWVPLSLGVGYPQSWVATGLSSTPASRARAPVLQQVTRRCFGMTTLWETVSMKNELRDERPAQRQEEMSVRIIASYTIAWYPLSLRGILGKLAHYLDFSHPLGPPPHSPSSVTPSSTSSLLGVTSPSILTLLPLGPLFGPPP
eukprot:4192761-Pyramimonas_sp.AAC.1